MRLFLKTTVLAACLLLALGGCGDDLGGCDIPTDGMTTLSYSLSQSCTDNGVVVSSVNGTSTAVEGGERFQARGTNNTSSPIVLGPLGDFFSQDTSACLSQSNRSYDTRLEVNSLAPSPADGLSISDATGSVICEITINP